MDTSVLDSLRDQAAEACARTERAFVAELGGGCSSPLTAYAAVRGGTLTVTGLYVDEYAHVRKGTASGPAADGTALAVQLARRLREDGPCPEK